MGLKFSQKVLVIPNMFVPSLHLMGMSGYVSHSSSFQGSQLGELDNYFSPVIACIAPFQLPGQCQIGVAHVL